MLLAKNDCVIIDFEGEPGHSFEERRAKQSPLRDVAGMLRSFSYAAMSALNDTVDTEEERALLAPLAEDWERQAQAAFLQAYAARSADTGIRQPVLPGRGLLGLFELEKALYELRYELNNRPDWVCIPLRGILGIMGAA